MRRAGWFLSAAVTVAVLSGGCASTPDAEGEAASEIMSGREHRDAKKLAEEYVAGFVASLKENDFKKLEAVIPADSKTKVTPEMFEQMHKELSDTMGTLIEAKFVTDLDKSIVRDYVWKFTFEKTVPDGKQKGRTIRNELFYMVRVGRLDGKYVIAGTGFRL
ncbi:MAG: hypothetical protein L6W00_17365 [Lentisphaeria bacterium]|nr:MAG: hypothetical protein L6W00_17365 [Lentisphaeria bacterium]